MKTLWALMTVGICVAACEGTETDNPVEEENEGPLVHFGAGVCKKNLDPDPGQQPLVESSEVEGLQCIAWEVDGESLAIRLLNFDGACGATWQGEAKLTEAGELELLVTNPGCLIAACGSCIYDFDFELAGVPTETELPLRVGFQDCPPDAAEWTHAATLELGGAASGSLCRFIPRGPLIWQTHSTGGCGGYQMPCGAECEGSSGCDDGLTCVAVDGDMDYRCLEPCEADAECTSPVNSCQEGTCRPAATL